MTARELLWVYVTHYSIAVYLALAAAGAGIAIAFAADPWGPIGASALVLILYPLVEYLLHRFVLHSTLFYRFRATAALWKRIHYDHHRNPNDLSVLFGALYTTLPTLFLLTTPGGWLIAGLPGAAAAFATSLVLFSGYELCHCIQHLPIAPRWAWLREIKRRHLAHHFHNEHGNFGITSFVWDRALGTLHDRARDAGRSPTVFTLGYAGEVRERYPWVAELSEDDQTVEAARSRHTA